MNNSAILGHILHRGSVMAYLDVRRVCVDAYWAHTKGQNGIIFWKVKKIVCVEYYWGNTGVVLDAYFRGCFGREIMRGRVLG